MQRRASTLPRFSARWASTASSGAAEPATAGGGGGRRALKAMVVLGAVGSVPISLGKLFDENEGVREMMVGNGQEVERAVDFCLTAYSHAGTALSNAPQVMENAQMSIEELKRKVMMGAPAGGAATTADVGAAARAESEMAELRRVNAALKADLENLSRERAAAVQAAAASTSAPVPPAASAAAGDEHTLELQRLQEKLQKKIKKIRRDQAKALAAAEERLGKEADGRVEAALNDKTHSFNTERVAFLADVEEVRSQVEMLRAELDKAASFQQSSVEANRVGLAACTFAGLSDAGLPVDQLIDGMRGVDNAVIDVTVASLPDKAVSTGVPPLASLEASFPAVLNKARHAGLVAEDSGLWGEIVAMVVNWLTIRRGLPSPSKDDTSTEAKLERAKLSLEDRKLLNAVAELEALSGQPKDVTQQWASNARNRAIMEQGRQLLEAEALLHGIKFTSK